MSRVSGLAELVRLMVLRGELGPGQRVLEAPLAQRLRTSRSTLREVLRRLEGEGLLMAGHSGGMRVVAPDEDDVAEALELRAALEALCAGRAAERVRRGEVAAADVTAAAGWSADDRRFHRALAALAGNRAASEALGRVWDRLLVAGRARCGDGDHGALLDAIGRGDPDAAAELARRHALVA